MKLFVFQITGRILQADPTVPADEPVQHELHWELQRKVILRVERDNRREKRGHHSTERLCFKANIVSTNVGHGGQQLLQ